MNVNSTNNATLMVNTGLETIRQLCLDNPHVSDIVSALQEVMVGRSVVRSELNGTLAVGMMELPHPITISPTNAHGPTDDDKATYRTFVRLAEHVS